MLIIAYKDTIWDGVYFKHDVSWRASNLCIFAGVISTVSSEVSVLTLTVITLDRLVCIVFPFRFRRWTMKKVSAIMCLVWIMGFAISLAPLFYDAYFYDYEHDVHFFGRSAVCLPLQLSSERPSGWEYSISYISIEYQITRSKLINNWNEQLKFWNFPSFKRFFPVISFFYQFKN